MGTCSVLHTYVACPYLSNAGNLVSLRKAMEGGDRMSRFREARHGRGAGDFPIRSRSSGGSAE
jgi:hypothetical protein